MWHSVEARTPFSDDINLIEYVFKQPSCYKVHDGTSKYLLRESVKQFIPSKIYERADKLGYVTPNNEWISQIYGSLKEVILSADPKIFNTRKIEKEFDSLFSSNASGQDNGRLFKFIALPTWQKCFFD